MNIAKIISVIAIVNNLLLVIAGILKAIKTQMDLNNPLFPREFINNLLFQDIIKVIVLLGIILLQVILFKKKNIL